MEGTVSVAPAPARASIPLAVDRSLVVRQFGIELFTALSAAYSELLADYTSAFEFLPRMAGVIGNELGTLCPDAGVLNVTCMIEGTGRLVIILDAERSLRAIAQGLIEGCVAHFGDKVDIAIEDLSDGAGTAARFVLTRPVGECDQAALDGSDQAATYERWWTRVGGRVLKPEDFAATGSAFSRWTLTEPASLAA